jgi:hypothetical protein
MSKPIEEGCRAVVVNSKADNNGVIVHVGEFIGDDDSFGFPHNKRHWSIDREIMSTDGSIGSSIPECLLKRIDDDNEELSSWEAVEKTIGFVPNREIA